MINSKTQYMILTCVNSHFIFCTLLLSRSNGSERAARTLSPAALNVFCVSLVQLHETKQILLNQSRQTNIRCSCSSSSSVTTETRRSPSSSCLFLFFRGGVVNLSGSDRPLVCLFHQSLILISHELLSRRLFSLGDDRRQVLRHEDHSFIFRWWSSPLVRRAPPALLFLLLTRTTVCTVKS